MFKLNKSGLLFETIKVEHGEFKNINYHLERMNNSRINLIDKEISMLLKQDFIDVCGHLLYTPTTSLRKLRIYYDEKIMGYDISDYKKREVKFLKKIKCDTLDYSFKYVNRSQLDILFSLKEAKCNDVLILKNGLVTDTTICNIVFYDGHKHYTPANPLLKGTCRQRLIDERVIYEYEIFEKDIKRFKSFKLINAMIDLDDADDIPVENIL